MKNKRLLIILFLFIGVIVINTIIHFTHPAYKFYKENISRLDREFNSFKDKVVYEFVPQINTISTNLTNNLFLNFENNVTNKFAKFVKQKSIIESSNNQSLLLSFKEENLQKEIYIDDYKYMEHGLKKYVRIYGEIYTVGDLLLGEVILSIDPLITQTKHYNFLSKIIQQNRGNNDNSTIR